jgi:hypothetical protein
MLVVELQFSTEFNKTNNRQEHQAPIRQAANFKISTSLTQMLLAKHKDKFLHFMQEKLIHIRRRRKSACK